MCINEGIVALALTLVGLICGAVIGFIPDIDKYSMSEKQSQAYQEGNVIHVEGDIFIGTDKHFYVYIKNLNTCARVDM